VNKIEQTVDKPRWNIGYTYCRWTVDELECIVDNIGLMEEKLDGLNSTTLDGQWKTKNIHFLTNQSAMSKLGNTVGKPGWDIGYT